MSTTDDNNKTDKRPKIFVPDTNIAIEDPYFIKSFLSDKNDKVYLPDVVIAEIDRLKKNADVGADAREFQDFYFNLLADGYDKENGIRVVIDNHGTLGGSFFLSNNYLLDGKDPLWLHPDIGQNDLQIIRTAAILTKKYPEYHVELVSNDKNLISVARANGILAKYRKDDSQNPEKLNKGYRIIDANKALLEKIVSYSPIPLDSIDEAWSEELVSNEYLVFPNEPFREKMRESYHHLYRKHFKPESRFIKRYDIRENALVPIKYNNDTIWGFAPRNIEQLLLFDLCLDDTIHLKTVRSIQGTGKSFIQLMIAIYKTLMRRRNKMDDAKISLIRRGITIEEYGFLPGDILDKNRMFYEGVERNFGQIMRMFSEHTKQYLSGTIGGILSEKSDSSPEYALPIKLMDALKEEDPFIELLPFGSIRGVSIGPRHIVIGEEWQNTEIRFSKMLIDRNSDGEVYLNGDFTQIDNLHTSPERNGHNYVIKCIGDISEKIREERKKLHIVPEVQIFDASIAGNMYMVKSERGMLSAWSERNLPYRGRR